MKYFRLAKIIYFVTAFFVGLTNVFAQETIVKGKVTDAGTGEPLAFAGVTFPGVAGVRATTDFEGNYTLKTTKPADSIRVFLVGFEPQVKKIVRNQSQEVDFQLKQERKELAPTVFKAKANPAHRILDGVIANRKYNSPESLNYYECENFNKTELAVNNISSKIKKNILTKKLGSLFDSSATLLNDSGKMILPIFVSESVTDFYFMKNPFKIKDYIKATRVNGIGVEDGSVVSQMTGTLFQTYNFYNDWVSVLEKQFPTPVNENYRKYYYYKILDSTSFIDGHRLYQIQIRKKHKNDLSFTGTIWIEDSVFAIRQMILEVDKSANLNFIEKIKFQQEFGKTESGPWLPVRTRISLDIDQLTNNSAGFVAKFYSTSTKIKTNVPHELRFYEKQITVAEDAKFAADTFWTQKREQAGTTNEQGFYNMVDSIKKLPVVKSYVDYVEFFVSGYKRIGKFDFGPYLLLYNYNVVEGNRFRLGITTNYKLSNRHYAGGYIAYGTRDQRYKYDLFYEQVLNRKHWLKLGASYRDDNEVIGLVQSDNSASSSLFSALSLFTSISRWGKCNTARLYGEWAPFETLTAKGKLEYKNFTPVGPYEFAYYGSDGSIQTDYKVLTANVELRYARGDVFLQNDFSRVNVGSLKQPAFTLAYTKGFKAPGMGTFDFHKVRFAMKQSIYYKRWGVGFYQLSAVKFFNRLPYTLLEVQPGNQSFIYNTYNYNLMRFVEFVADESYSGYYEHNFEGAFLNHIKGVRDWKLRLFANVRGVWGRISEKNWTMIPDFNKDNEPVAKFQRFTNQPYIELGYGIENIFRLVRVDLVHRMNYLNSPQARPFGVFLSVQFKL